MFFTRTHKFSSSAPKEELWFRLAGKHVQIHNLDFEIFEKDESMRIIPHAEQIKDIKTLPITYVNFRERNNRTEVVVTSKMRTFDAGGPILILIFCGFLFLASIAFYLLRELNITYSLLISGIVIFSIFWVRLQMGYFDYIRKIQAYVKSKCDPERADVTAIMA